VGEKIASFGTTSRAEERVPCQAASGALSSSLSLERERCLVGVEDVCYSRETSELRRAAVRL